MSHKARRRPKWNKRRDDHKLYNLLAAKIASDFVDKAFDLFLKRISGK